MNLVEQSVQIPAGGVALDADMAVPEPATGVVLFAHGSGSSRHSPRNRYVAGELQASGLATVLADLLTPAEEQLDARTGRLRFDVGLLVARVMALTEWVVQYRPTAGLPVGPRCHPQATIRPAHIRPAARPGARQRPARQAAPARRQGRGRARRRRPDRPSQGQGEPAARPGRRRR
jgi:putative phosphoribosyl transferase